MKTRELEDLAGKTISIDIFQTPASATAAIVVAYGTEGMNAPFDALINDFCETTAKAGYVTILPHYFESTGTTPGLSGVVAHLNTKVGKWIDTLAAGANWAKGKVTSGKVGLVGFSLGANLVLNTALKTKVDVVVDYFGPVDQFGVMAMPATAKLSQPRVKGLPPILIHHGNKDKIVPTSQSSTLKSWLNLPGQVCELHDDYNCGHPGQPENDWTPAANDSATQETLKFLKTYF